MGEKIPFRKFIKLARKAGTLNLVDYYTVSINESRFGEEM